MLIITIRLIALPFLLFLPANCTPHLYLGRLDFTFLHPFSSIYVSNETTTSHLRNSLQKFLSSFSNFATFPKYIFPPFFFTLSFFSLFSIFFSFFFLILYFLSPFSSFVLPIAAHSLSFFFYLVILNNETSLFVDNLANLLWTIVTPYDDILTLGLGPSQAIKEVILQKLVKETLRVHNVC